MLLSKWNDLNKLGSDLSYRTRDEGKDILEWKSPNIDIVKGFRAQNMESGPNIKVHNQDLL